MKRFLIAAAACLFALPSLANPGGAADPLHVRPGHVIPIGYCQLSVTAAVKASTCTGGIPLGSHYALICNEGTAARWRDDTPAPTTTVGQILGTGTATAPVCMGFSGEFKNLQFIAESGTALLDISFYQ